MRNALILLSSLALAASSRAGLTAIATSQMKVGYILGAKMTVAYNPVSTPTKFPPRTAGEYVYSQFAPGRTDPQVFDFDSPDVPVDPSHYTASISGGATDEATDDVLSLASTTTGAFTGKDGDLVLFRRYGFRYFLQVTNDDASPQDVTFAFDGQSRYAKGDIDTPLDTVANLGQYAESGGVADVVDTAIDDDPPEYSFFADTFDSAGGTGYEVPKTYPSGGSRTFKVPGEGNREFEIYCASYVFLEDDRRPALVPQPSAFAALGLGALPTLRHTRK